jgi:gatB/yqey family protein
MSLKEILNKDIKSAMKAKDKETLAVLRMIKTAVQAAEIDKKEELNAEEELTILAREAKQRRESLAEFVKAGRDELVAKTETEIEIVERYLPKQLSVEEVKEVIATVAEKIGATTQKEFGKLMGAVMQELKGKADGNVIKEQVKAHLG